MRLLTIDPGKNLGWAMFENGQLIETGLVEDCSLKDALGMAFTVCERYQPDDVIIELPQVYQQRLWKGDPNDLVSVAVIAGVVAGTVIPYIDREPQLVRPHTWKGNRPKDVDNKHTLSVLDDTERAKIPSGAKRHNVLDAVGIGLWKLGRK